jgi:hypothetical protein
VDIQFVFGLVNTGVQILVGKIRIFGVQRIDKFDIGSMCHVIKNTFEGLSHSKHCYHRDWFRG